ncbi:MAG: phosphotransferase [Deltaproteobacteria bacterium]|nr:phosphotransferase [Deltaproteobacteria bacterium]
MTRVIDAREAAGLLGPLLSPGQRVLHVSGLAGDASTRRYFRARLSPGGRFPSLVVMAYPDEVPPGEELPFLNVHRYLAKAGVPVPAVYRHVPEAKTLILEDAGDTMLEGAVHAARAFAECLPLYEQCVETLVRIQADGTAALDGRAHPRRLAFDVAKFAEEIDFFFAHAVREFGGIALSEAEERRIEDLFLPFLETLAALPPVLAHRDYHSRNVMVLPAATGAAPALRVLDFQDARMGTVYYDLASLFRDSYVTLPEEAVGHLSYAYRHAAPASLRKAFGDPGAFAFLLDAAALQRNVKAIGTFGNQAHNRGKTFYLRFIPPTVAHLRRNFERNPEMGPLAGRLLPILETVAGGAAAGVPP